MKAGSHSSMRWCPGATRPRASTPKRSPGSRSVRRCKHPATVMPRPMDGPPPAIAGGPEPVAGDAFFGIHPVHPSPVPHGRARGSYLALRGPSPCAAILRLHWEDSRREARTYCQLHDLRIPSGERKNFFSFPNPSRNARSESPFPPPPFFVVSFTPLLPARLLAQFGGEQTDGS